jgi:signal transduction histidine kinase/ligand-binding sensor domain-containing protein/DNA-binding response OmpR family regulator
MKPKLFIAVKDFFSALCQTWQKKNPIFVSALILFSLSLFSQSDRQRYLNITSVTGVENPVVTCVYHDSFGFTWFGSLNGLYRWDGNKAQHFYHIPGDTSSMPADQIISILFEDSDGNLWTCALGAGIMKYNRSTEKFQLYNFHNKKPELFDDFWVLKAFQDDDGNIWGISELERFFKCSIKANNIEIISPDTVDISNPANSILSILFDQKSDCFWVGTKIGLFKYFIKENRFIPVQLDFTNNKKIANLQIIDIHQEDDELLWIATSDAVYKYNIKDQNTDIFFKIKHDKNVTALEQIEGFIGGQVKYQTSVWLMTNKGILGLNKTTGISTIYSIKDREKMFESSEFFAAKKSGFIDRNGFLWLATDNMGATMINLNESPFEQFLVSENNTEQASNGATAFYLDSKKHLWVGTGFNGLYQLDEKMKLINTYKHNSQNPNSLINNSIFSLFESKKGTMWVGTENGLNRLDRNSNKFQQYITELLIFKGSRPTIRIAEIFQDSTERLWIGTSQGVYYSDNCDEEKTDFIPFEGITRYYATIQHIISDRAGDLWFTNPIYHGLYRLTKEAGDEWKVINYNRRNQPDNGNFVTDGALCMYEDDTGYFWLGTKEGLYKWNRSENTFIHYYKGNGLDANMIYWMEADNNGNLWLSTEIGLVRFNSSLPNERMSKKFTYKDGLPFEDMYPYRFYKSPDGMMYIGGRRGSGNGFFRFHPDSIVQNIHLPPVIITDFSVHGKHFPLDSNIVVTRQITLYHNEDFFSFEFAALDYTDPEKNQYAYYLEGFEDDWNYSGNRRNAFYTSVPPGDYVFRVKGSNNDGFWNEAGTSIAITILPPPWKTWWAFTLYGLAFLGIIIAVFYFYFRRQQLIHALEIEHVESEKLKELDQLRSRFFANISHEFRTPLTLILGPLEKILTKSSADSEHKELGIARKYAQRLQNLVNQVLTISKLESGKMQLYAAETNIVKLVSSYLQAFESLAKQKNIVLKFTSENEEIIAFIDREKFEQVLNNLLSNAFKFTEEGEINVSIGIQQSAVGKPDRIGLQSVIDPGLTGDRILKTEDSFEKRIQITISDTGCGIPSEHIEHVFDRFYQVENTDSNFFQGTGIGLALTRELIELHYGTINVKSEPGKGSVFSIFLPLGKEHLKPEEITSLDIDESLPEFSNLFFTETIVKEDNFSENLTGENDNLPELLIVEDNADMRAYIREFFNKEFEIIEAVDGEDGYEKSVKHIPDIVISDVMMPKMDGNEFCKKVKSDDRTCHIPVILLTAKASKESRIESLEFGADDFITKPFDGEELQVRVRNLIEQRKNLINHYKTAFELSQANEPLKSLDRNELFLQKAKSIVEQHISNNEFGVESFASKMSLSRVQLHRKLRALVDNSATEFIRSIRLTFALELLKKKDRTISEIAYDAGFNNPTYFSSSFHQKYGISPTDYLKSIEPKKPS